MITPDSLITLAKKHGALGVMAVWLTYTTYRLDAVEQKLYGCFDELKERPALTGMTKRIKKSDVLYAVLPKEIQVRKEKKTITI
jgi:hypothetical protein